MADVGAVGAGSEVDVASACVGDCCVSEGEGRWMANMLEILFWKGGGWVVGVHTGGAVGGAMAGFKLEAGDNPKSLGLSNSLFLFFALQLVSPHCQSSQPLFSLDPFIVLARVAPSL